MDTVIRHEILTMKANKLSAYSHMDTVSIGKLIEQISKAQMKWRRSSIEQRQIQLKGAENLVKENRMKVDERSRTSKKYNMKSN